MNIPVYWKLDLMHILVIIHVIPKCPNGPVVVRFKVNFVIFLKVLHKLSNMSHELLSLFCRLLDVRHAQQSPTEIRLMLVFEYIDQDLSTYLQRCPSPGLGPERIRVGNTAGSERFTNWEYLHGRSKFHSQKT